MRFCNHVLVSTTTRAVTSRSKRRGIAAVEFAVVVPFFPRRLPDSTYEMTLLPAFENFPGDDAVADTRRYVEVLERHIRSCPEQYFWVHRKFKNLPDEYPDYYEDLDALK